MLYILDTDHISLLQRDHVHVTTRFKNIPFDLCGTTVITVEEQVRGWLNLVNRVKGEEKIALNYENLSACIAFYTTMPIVPYDDQAAKIFKHLRSEGIRIGTKDLRIAAIALSNQLTVVTRNTRDFGLVPDLACEDWSQPVDAWE